MVGAEPSGAPAAGRRRAIPIGGTWEADVVHAAIVGVAIVLTYLAACFSFRVAGFDIASLRSLLRQ